MQFTYDYIKIADLVVNTKTDVKTGKKVVENIVVNDEVLTPTSRFWASLFSRFHINNSFFKYYEYAEVFERIAAVEASDRIRVCVERTVDKFNRNINRLLAVTNPKSVIVPYDELTGLLEDFGNDGIKYADGLISSFHRPRGAEEFTVLGDSFGNRFQLDTPVDGYGAPNVYLSFLRYACQNDLVAAGKTFRSNITLGKDSDNIAFALTRVLDQFNNEEGYAALRQRLESSGQSWASVYESTLLYKLLARLHTAVNPDGTPALHKRTMTTPYCVELMKKAAGDIVLATDEALLGSPIMNAFHAMTGDTSRIYGLANLDALSVKRQRTLPVRCTVYDMINFVTEIATHYTSPVAARQLNGWIGGLLSNEYDMEGTKTTFGDFADFHINLKDVEAEA